MASWSAMSPTDASTGNAILSNSIYGNAGIGIDLGNIGVLPDHSSPTTGIIAGTPNGDQNFPVLTSAIFVPDMSDSNGTLTVSLALEGDARHHVHHPALRQSRSSTPSGYGQGQTLVASFSVTTDASGNVSGTFSSRQPTSRASRSRPRRPIRTATPPSSART